jgi:hypothetical protein
MGETFGDGQGAYQVHVDVAETACRDWDVLWRYLDMAVNFGSLAVQAGFCPGRDIRREAFPNIPG